MQTIQKNRYFIDPQTLPKGVTLEQIERALGREQTQGRHLESTQQSLRDLMSTYRTARLEILGEDGDRQLNEFMQQHRQAAPDLAQPQPASLDTQLEELGSGRLAHPEPPVPATSLASLKALNAETKRKFNAIIESDSALAETSQLREVSSSEFSSLGSAYYPPYGWWDRDIFDGYDFATGNGKIKQHQGFLSGSNGQTGSCLWGRNMSASNADLIQMTRGNGFLLGYTTPKKGILRVGVELECGFCQHCIQTWDEFGWSDVSAVTRELLSVGLLYKWEDPDLAVENSSTFVHGLRASGDGENSPGVAYPFHSGQKLYFVRDINVQLFAGIGVYIYVGTEQQAWSWLNDVSCNIFANSAWYVKRVNVQTV